MATVQEIAAAEKINPSYISRVLRLTLLAPVIVEAEMEADDAAPLDRLMVLFPVEWSRQLCFDHYRSLSNSEAATTATLAPMLQLGTGSRP